MKSVLILIQLIHEKFYHFKMPQTTLKVYLYLCMAGAAVLKPEVSAVCSTFMYAQNVFKKEGKVDKAAPLLVTISLYI